jgi:hypothetical protein
LFYLFCLGWVVAGVLNAGIGNAQHAQASGLMILDSGANVHATGSLDALGACSQAVDGVAGAMATRRGVVTLDFGGTRAQLDFYEIPTLHKVTIVSLGALVKTTAGYVHYDENGLRLWIGGRSAYFPADTDGLVRMQLREGNSVHAQGRTSSDGEHASTLAYATRPPAIYMAGVKGATRRARCGDCAGCKRRGSCNGLDYCHSLGGDPCDRCAQKYDVEADGGRVVLKDRVQLKLA